MDLEKGRWPVDLKMEHIPYLKAENAHGRHILVRPAPLLMPYYMMIDDISPQLLHRQHQDKNHSWRAGRLVIETSPRNYQVWIRSSIPLSLETKRYWLKRFHSDPGADPNNRWGRCPGFRNRKEKHRDAEGGYPLSRLIWVDWQRLATPALIKQAQKKARSFSPQPPGGGVCRSGPIRRSFYERGNESQTDFTYALAMMRRGYQDNEIRTQIILERNDWHNHGSERKKQSYLKTTIKNARSVFKANDSATIV
ncbi:MAG: hypothetical protein GY774_09785 [Planctomycetes bacterium]|nr:hypothetical protein [Planctomycetota bacterium]